MEVVDTERINEKVYTAKVINGFTDKQLGNALGMTSDTLNSRRANGNTWKFGELVKLKNLTGCDLDEFTKEVEE